MARRKDPEDQDPQQRQCRECGRVVAAHTAPPCLLCGRPPEHHQPGDLADEWEGRSRMAAARQAAGLPLDATDQAALARHPGGTGYVGAG